MIGAKPQNDDATYITDPYTGIAQLNPNSLRAKVIQRADAQGRGGLSSPTVRGDHRAMVRTMEQENLTDEEMRRKYGDQYTMFLRQIGA